MSGQTLAAKVLAEALIDFAAFKRKEVFEHGTVVVLEPGDSLFSLAELADLTSATPQQIRDARLALERVGFCKFWRAGGGARARTVYRLSQWWRFIQVGKAGELDPVDASPDRGSQSVHGLSASNSMANEALETTQDHSRITVRTQSEHTPARQIPRAFRAQSANHMPGQDAGVCAPARGPGQSWDELSAELLRDLRLAGHYGGNGGADASR